MDPRVVRKGLVFGRAAVGIAGLLVPRLLMRVFGIDPVANPALPLVTRLFAIRDLVMAWQLGTASDDAADAIVRQHMVVDAVDGASSLLAGVAGYVPMRSALSAAFAAAGGAGTGLVAQEG